MINTASSEFINGTFKGVWSRYFPNIGSALYCEVEACQTSILLAIYQGRRSIELDCDSSLIVATLNHQTPYDVEVSRLLEDCKSCMIGFDFIRIRHVFRETNSVTHRLIFVSI